MTDTDDKVADDKVYIVFKGTALEHPLQMMRENRVENTSFLLTD